MTISSTDDPRAGPFNGNGSQTAFPFEFKAFAEEDLLVVQTDEDGLETTLVLDSDYTVTLNADQNADPGGTVTAMVAPPTGETLTIASNLDFTQETDITNGGGFYPEVLETALDRVTMLVKQVGEKVNRALRVAVSTPDDVSVELPAPDAQKIIGWNDTATGLVNRDISDFATVVAFAAWQSQTFNGTGAQTVFVLSSDPGNINNLDIAISGVTQVPGVDFTLSGTTLTFLSAPPSGTANIFVRWGQALPQGTTTAVQVSVADAGGYFASTEVESALQELGRNGRQGSINVAWFAGADPTGVTDNTAIFAAAAAFGHRIYVPAGTWAVNWTITSKIIIEGDGSNATFIKPYNTAQAALTLNVAGNTWTYHTQIRDLCLLGTAGVGVGFTCAKTDPTTYAANDEYINNVTFWNVRFRLLRIGAQFPFGNIGKQFYNCSFSECFYGIYSIDAKFGGLMHAGNLYVQGGEMSRCACAVYAHNVTDGFGGLSFDNVIFESNSISTYIYSNNTFTPVMFRNCWNENNGVISGTGSPVLLDQWAGSVKSTTSFTARAYIFDGSNSKYEYHGGRVSDFYLKATNSEVASYDSVGERMAGVGAANCTVDDANSQIRLFNPLTDKGLPFGRGIIVEGAYRYRAGNTIDSSASNASSRWAQVPHRYTKIAAFGDMANSVVLPLTGSTNVTGSLAPVVGSVVSDGVIYTSCNEWVIPFTTSSQYMSITGSTVTTAAGWYVATINLKVTSGTCEFFLWNQSTVQMAASATIQNGEWVTLAAIAYSPGAQSFFFDIRGAGASVTVRASAYQVKHFGTKIEAEQFLNSRVYVSS